MWRERYDLPKRNDYDIAYGQGLILDSENSPIKRYWYNIDRFSIPHIKLRRACRNVLGTEAVGKPKRDQASCPCVPSQLSVVAK